MYMIYYIIGIIICIVSCVLSILNKKNKTKKEITQTYYHLVSDDMWLSWKLYDVENNKYKLVLKDYASSGSYFIIKTGYCEEINKTYIKNGVNVNNLNIDNMIIALSEYNKNDDDWFELIQLGDKYIVKLNIFNNDHIYLHKGLCFESEIRYDDLLFFNLVKSQS